MRIITTSKSPNEVQINVFAEEAKPTKEPEYTTEFWCGHMFTTSSRSEEHVCDICGARTPADRGKGLALGKAARVASWIDIARPEGDTRRYAHLECLEKVHADPYKWPSGTVYRPRKDTTARIAQQRAIKRLIAEGVDKIDAWKLCSYHDGKPPKIIGEVLNREFAPLPSDVVDPMFGDAVRLNNGFLGVVSGLKRLPNGVTRVTEVRVNEGWVVQGDLSVEVRPVHRGTGESLSGKRYRV